MAVAVAVRAGSSGEARGGQGGEAREARRGRERRPDLTSVAGAGRGGAAGDAATTATRPAAARDGGVALRATATAAARGASGDGDGGGAWSCGRRRGRRRARACVRAAVLFGKRRQSQATTPAHHHKSGPAATTRPPSASPPFSPLRASTHRRLLRPREARFHSLFLITTCLRTYLQRTTSAPPSSARQARDPLPLLRRPPMAALLRSAARRLTTAPVARAAFSSAAAPAPSSGREGVIAAAAVAAAGSGLGLWLMPPGFADSGDASAGQISAAESAGAGAVEERHERRRRFLLGDSYRRRVFFNYEKRIRLLSPPEKIFEYFSSVRKPDGELFMLPADLMRAVVPVFPPSESNVVREGRLRGERNPGELHCAPSKFFALFDTNTDGLISFAEYIFFVTLLSIPESNFSAAFKMFDIDLSG
ncbi:hypothetical protein ACQ4PT_050847 [Festuca glaucescens]